MAKVKVKKIVEQIEPIVKPKTRNHYVTKADLIAEITKSKAIKKKYPKRNPAECLTAALVDMIRNIVEKFGTLPNWRSYCVDEATECLTQRGWLNMDQLTTDDLILSYKDGALVWSAVKSIYCNDDYDDLMFHLTSTGFDTFVSPNHKVLTTKGLKEIEYLREKDRLILMGDPVASPEEVYDDRFVELVGWAVTEGTYYDCRDRNYTRISIYQNSGAYADRIRSCLESMGTSFGEGIHEKRVTFTLRKEICEKINDVAPDRVLSMDFILKLSQRQRQLLIETMIDGDGWRTREGKSLHYCQVCKKHTDSFIALCTIAGYRTSTTLCNPQGYGRQMYHKIRIMGKLRNIATVSGIDFHGGKNPKKLELKVMNPNRPTIPYKGRIWCPETEHGVFMARRNGYVYLTGNSFQEDMVSTAIVAVCNNALKFDPEKSSEPFNYYTMIANRTFLTYIDTEKRQRDIRDDIIEMNSSKDILPSFARQNLHEQTQLGRTLDGTRRIPMKRGRYRRRKSSVLDSIPLHTIDSEPPPTVED